MICMRSDIKKSLDSFNAKHVVSLFEDNNNFEILNNNLSDVLPIITRYSIHDYCKNESFLDDWKHILIVIAQKFNEEDVLSEFVEELENSEITKFLGLLQPICIALTRIQENLPIFLHFSLDSITSAFWRIQDTHNVKEETHDLYNGVINFYQMLLQHFRQLMEFNQECKWIVSKYLVNLIPGNTTEKFVASYAYDSVITKKLVTEILIVVEIFSYSIENRNESYNPNDESYTNLLYLILCDNIGNELLPKVFETSFVFFSVLQYIVKLLECGDFHVITKVFRFIASILEKNHNFSHHYLHFEENQTFTKILERIIVYNSNEICRKRGLDIFKQYVNCFDIKGKYLLLFNLVPNIAHSGLAGFAIVQYKEILVELQKSESVHLKYFDGEKLQSFIQKCIILDDVDWNVMKDYDRIVSILNLLRFVAVQRKHENAFFKKLVRDYLNKILHSVDECNKQLSKSESEIRMEKNEPELEITVDDEDLPKTTDEQKLKNIALGRTNNEMIRSLIDRVYEIML